MLWQSILTAGQAAWSDDLIKVTGRETAPLSSGLFAYLFVQYVDLVIDLQLISLTLLHLR